MKKFTYALIKESAPQEFDNLKGKHFRVTDDKDPKTVTFEWEEESYSLEREHCVLAQH